MSQSRAIAPLNEFQVEVLDVPDSLRDGEECVICLTQKKDHVFIPCGHQCLCGPCATRFKRQARHQICPICRVRIREIMKVYK